MKQVMALQSEDEFFDWVERQHGSNELFQKLSRFHQYLRQSTEIKRGVRLQYLKRMYKTFDEDGELPDDPEYSSALRKYREFKNSAGDVSQTPTGENQ